MDLTVSTFPATSVEKYAIVCAPSFEPSLGAGMVTLVPDWNEPPSTAYWVSDGPEPPSEAERWTVTSEDCQPLGASSVVVGGVLSTRLVTTFEAALFPATSTATARRS